MQARAIILLAVAALSGVRAQSLISGIGPNGPLRLKEVDAAVLDLKKPRSDLPCKVTTLKARFGFEFLFHAGYEVSIPLNELAGTGNMLNIVFRVAAEDGQDNPVYFEQKTRVPPIDDDAAGKVMLAGEFLVGEGKYRVDWLVRDREGRICARFWSLEAKTTAKEGLLAADIVHDVIQPLETTPFAEDSPVSRKHLNRALAVKVIVNFASQNLETPTLGRRDIDGLASILRKIGSESQVGSYSVVACSVQRQQVIYRQKDAPKIDLPALGEALNSVSFEKVDVKQLAGKNAETGFLARLLAEEMGKDNPDALIFISPKCPLDSHLPREVIDRLKNLDHPVFYLNYNLYPSSFPWRDAIGQVVKQLHGFEYTITRPRDLLNAWSDIVSRIARAKQSPGPSRTGL